jgi:hypothetical protein
VECRIPDAALICVVGGKRYVGTFGGENFSADNANRLKMAVRGL